MPNSDPRDGFVYPHLTLMKESYSLHRVSKLSRYSQREAIQYNLTISESEIVISELSIGMTWNCSMFYEHA